MDMMERVGTAGPPKPPICYIYGRPGIGKTTLAFQAPNPIGLQTEDGMTAEHLRDCPTFGLLQSYDEVLAAIDAVAKHHKEQGWQTVVVDSVDRLMPLVAKHVCVANGWRRLEDGDFGKGKSAFRDEMRSFLTYMLFLKREYGLGIIMLGHHKSVRVNPPDADPFIQYAPSLDDDIRQLVIADSDLVGFATYPTHVVSANEGFGKKTGKAVLERPVLVVQESGSQIAKNRFNMPERIPLSWPDLAQYVPAWRETAKSTEETAA